MKNRYQVAFSAGLLAAVWCGIADYFHLVSWVGFLGCSTYFAQTRQGFQGVLLSWATNLTGVFWAWFVIAGGSFFDSQMIGYLLTGISGAMMCLQAADKRLNFIPGAFIGSCTTFAMGGDIANLILPLVLGSLLGYSMAMFTQPLVYITDICKNKLIKSTHTPNTSSAGQ